MKVRAYEFDLSIPRDDYEIVEPGTELTVDVCTGEAWVRIGSKDLDPIPLHRIGSVHNASFTKLYLTNRSQPGKVLRFYVGFDVKISRAYLTFQDILSVISDQKRLIEEFTSKDIIKQLVLNNIITGEMIKYNEIMEHHIADRQITSRLLDTAAVGTEHIKHEAIVSDLIASNSILAHHIAAGAITSDHITAQAIRSYHIAANSILAHHIYAGAITATHIAASSITVEKLESTLYGDLIQYIAVLRTHLVSAESVSFTITEGIFSDGTLENCYGIMYYGNFHIYSMTLNRWDDESLTWDDDDLRWDVPTHEISVWESDVFELDNVLTASLSVDLVANDYESLSVYAKFSVDNQQWSDWEELRSHYFSNRWIFFSIIRNFKYFRIKLIFSGYTDIYDVKIFAMSALLNADMLNGKRDTDFASANHDHDSVYASINHTHDATYVRKLVSDTITAVHTFNPSTVGAPFTLGTNAQGQLVAGLNADLLDGQHASAFASSSHNHDTTYVRKSTADTITAVHTFNPSTVGAPFVLGANAQNQLVTGFNADMVDGYHASILVKKYDPPSFIQREVISTFGDIAGSRKYVGGVLAPNGRIYCAPYGTSVSSILVIDPANDSVSTFGNPGPGYYSGVLAPNGKIYFTPCSLSRPVLVVNPADNSFYTFGSTSGYALWTGAALATNGMIYCVPYNATQILKIDPSKDTMSLFGSFSDFSKWWSSAIAPNGKIYCAPCNASQILVIDPSNDSTALVGSFSGTSKWAGVVLAPNGKLYFIPYSATQVLCLDPTDNSVTLIGNFSGTGKWFGGVLAPNGKIYCVPQNTTQVLCIDPTDNSTTLFGSFSENVEKWRGAVVAPNGAIYCIPHDSTQVLKITLFETNLYPWVISPYLNKF